MLNIHVLSRNHKIHHLGVLKFKTCPEITLRNFLNVMCDVTTGQLADDCGIWDTWPARFLGMYLARTILKIFTRTTSLIDKYTFL